MWERWIKREQRRVCLKREINWRWLAQWGIAGVMKKSFSSTVSVFVPALIFPKCYNLGYSWRVSRLLWKGQFTTT